MSTPFDILQSVLAAALPANQHAGRDTGKRESHRAIAPEPSHYPAEDLLAPISVEDVKLQHRRKENEKKYRKLLQEAVEHAHAVSRAPHIPTEETAYGLAKARADLKHFYASRGPSDTGKFSGKPWTAPEDNAIRAYVAHYGIAKVPWNEIKNQMECRTTKQVCESCG